MLLRDFSSFDTMLLHLKFQTCFVLPGLISVITIMPAEFSIKIIMYVYVYNVHAVYSTSHLFKKGLFHQGESVGWSPSFDAFPGAPAISLHLNSVVNKKVITSLSWLIKVKTYEDT